MSEIKCPKCDSNLLTVKANDFVKNDTSFGDLTIGKNEVTLTCLACGNNFKAEEGSTTKPTVTTEIFVTQSSISSTELDATTKRIIELCSTGNKLEAIKYYKGISGLGLKESKEFIDNFVIQHNITAAAGSGKCFVATACYGDYDAPEVMVLRHFRDDKLLKTFLGKVFVEFYYSISPFFATLISKSNLLKKLVRQYFLQPIINRLQKVD